MAEVFKDSIFLILLSKELGKEQAKGYKTAIESGGGEALIYPTSKRIDFDDGVTHIISLTSDFPQYAEAQDYYVPVVTPSWITQSLMKGKQATYRPYTPDPTLFFSNVVICCGDIPSGDKDAIIGAVLALGGMETSSMTRLTTHICALTMDHPVCKAVQDKKLKTKIVLPHWFDDCLKLGKRIEETPYLLPDPEIFRKHREEDVPIPDSDHMAGATSSVPTNLNLQVPMDSPALRRLTIFADKAVMISNDLNMSSRIRTIIESLIEGGGGTMTTSIQKANMYVCHYRHGRDYVIASRAGIDVGNLSWLYYLITHNEWTSPFRRLMHYPLPKEPLPGFERLKITLSNYGGDARVYLENLVRAAGAEFTKNMKEENTHLITARNTSEKCEAAKEWDIEMVNHLWIEESYAKCKAQKLSDPRYTHFPPRTNLGEVIGQTQFDEETLAQIYFPRDPTPSPDDPELLKRPPMHEKDQNRAISKASDEDIQMADMSDEEPKKVEKGSSVKPKKALPKTKARTSTDSVSTPAPSRRISLDKENNTPSSTNSRSAKDKALNKLHGLAPDIALYEKEKKRKGAVWGGERAANKIEKERSLERSSSPAAQSEEEEEYSADDQPKPKRSKISAPTLPPAEIRLLITGYKKWIEKPEREEKDRRKLRELGILVVQDPTSCTHLAAPSMVRTKKFLCALASGPTIVSAGFIDHCIEHGEIPHAADYPLGDTTNEKKFKLKLKDALVRAKANRRCLLKGISAVYCTAEIPNGTDTYRDIVTANGGTFLIFRGRGVPTIKPTKPEEDDGPAEPVYLLSGDRPEEKKIWSKFTEMAEAGNMIPRIVKTEWLLDVAMSQELKWNDVYLATSR
ncbi:hypothetical protein B0O99DRAFT_26080 [Bisporella sp. PMI_857]|nr:hypothetical protein B0O99DRAFT_26080 [Bisporella sp. PMI_857]